MNWYWGCLLLCYALVCQMACGMGIFPMPLLPIEGLVHFEMISNSLKLFLQNDESYGSLLNILQLLDSPPDGDVAKQLLESATATVSIAVNNVDKDSILSIFSLPGDKFKQFLASHPEWTQSASSFTQKFVDSKIKPVIDQQTSSILDGFYGYLNANPDLKLSASEYAVKFWEENVLTRSRETIDFLAISPLAKNTASFIESIQSYHLPAFSSSLDTSSTVPKLDILGAKFGENLKEKINENFDTWLNSNPKLKLPASEYTKDFFATEFFPRYDAFYSVYRTSPLAQATNRFTSTSTSEFTSEVVSNLQVKFQPLTDGLAGVTQKIVQKTFEPFYQLTTSIPPTTGLALPSTDFTPNLTPFTTVSEKLETFKTQLLEKSTFLQEQVFSSLPKLDFEKVLEKTGSSLARANSEFSLQLLAKTQVLSDNTLSFFEKLTSGVGKIAIDAVTVLPSRSLQLLEESTKSSVLQVEALDNAQSQLFTQSETVLSTLKTKVLTTLEEAQQWRLFSDQNHMQNGFWERKIVDLTSFVEKVANSETERNKVVDEVTARLTLAQENFVRQLQVAQSQSPINRLLIKFQQVDFSKAQQTNEEFQVKVQELQRQWEVTSSQLKLQLEGLTQSLSKKE